MTNNIELPTVIFIGILVFMCHFHYIFATPSLMINVFQHFSGLDPPTLPALSGSSCVPTYTEDMSRAYAFSQLKRNQMIDPFIMYLDCLVVEDMYFNNNVDHH